MITQESACNTGPPKDDVAVTAARCITPVAVLLLVLVPAGAAIPTAGLVC